MPWERRRYRKNKVWVRVDARGHAVLDDRSLAALRYKPDDERTYTVRPDEIAAVEAEQAAPATSAGDLSLAGRHTGEEPRIEIYVRGKGAPHAAAAGLGIVLCWRDQRREIQRYLSEATEQEAQLAAVLAALEAVQKPSLNVTVFTDSRLGAEGLAKPPTATGDLAIWRQIRQRSERFRDLTFSPAPTESSESTRAERLASDAIHSCRSD